MSAPPLRLISSRARALGTGDFDSLENVDTTILPNGSACWVADTQTWYVLDHAAVAGPPNITPGNGPGFWTPLGGGTGGGIPMPDGTLILPQGANFANELGLGWFRPAAGLMGLAVGGFLGLQAGNGTVTNVDPLSPSIVRYVMRGFNHALTGGENEVTFSYVRIDPSIANPQQAALYVDITGNQLDTYGPAIKVVHAGHGDGIYVAQFADGSAYEAATWANGSRGYISTVQAAGCPNSTLFNALWDQADVPNFGMYYADLSTANALTIRKRAATAVDGLTQVRLLDELGLQRFGMYNDGSVAMSPLAATAGVPLQASPELRLFSTAWDGAVSRDNEWIIKGNPSSTTVGTLAFYQTTTSGTVLAMQLDNNGAVANSNVLTLTNGRIVATRADVLDVQSSIRLHLLFNGGTLGMTIDDVLLDDDTAIRELLVRSAGPVYTNKKVTQGAVDTGGVGFRALVVPN
jgi:hypothetical protein